MLHILSIKVKGFKLLEDDFKIDLLAKSRVYEVDKEKEIMEIDKGLYTFRTISFVGGNSSGKSTVLSLFLKVATFLQSGRWEYASREFKGDDIKLEVVFYLDGKIYKYKVTFDRCIQNTISSTNIYCPIRDENLCFIVFDKTKGKKNIEILEKNAISENSIIEASLLDTSAIVKLTNNKILVDDFYTNNIINFKEGLVRNTFFSCLNSCSRNLVSSIIKLLDDSIEYIINESNENVRFKRIGEEEINMSYAEVISILSAGTFRGVELYIRAINALKNGKIFVVDEIENCFQKNLVNNLLFIFNDSLINKYNSQLVFSTHYVEVLDYLSRRDSIFITHKNFGRISVNNLYSDYNVRTELLKSKQFDNNVFNTSLNYKQLLEVRRNLLNELHINND